MRGIYIFAGTMAAVLILVSVLAISLHFQAEAECETKGGVLYRSLCIERDTVILGR